MLFELNGSHEQLFAFERIVTVWSTAPDLALCLPLGVSANANIFKNDPLSSGFSFSGCFICALLMLFSAVLKGRK